MAWLTDVELRYRQRYVDLFMNPEVREVFLKRSQAGAVDATSLSMPGIYRSRNSDDAADRGRRGGRAVHHPSQYARHRSLSAHCARALSEALTVGGFDRVYEINRNFRNEGFRRGIIPNSPCWSFTRPTPIIAG